MLLEPVLNPIWTFLFAGERPGPWALAGGAIVLAATAWRPRPSPRSPAAARRPRGAAARQLASTSTGAATAGTPRMKPSTSSRRAMVSA